MAHNNKTWYEKAVFYHMYPLGMTGAPKQNIETEAESRFGELNLWIPHIKSLNCSAVYIGPLFESSTHGYDTRIISWWTGVWEQTMISELLSDSAMNRKSVLSLTGYLTIPDVISSLSVTFVRTGNLHRTGTGTEASILAGTARWEIPSAMSHGTASGSFPA